MHFSRYIAVRVGILILLIILLIGAVWLLPKTVALYHISRAGQLLNQVVASQEDPDAIICTQAPISNATQQQVLENSISHLDRAIDQSPSLAQAFLLRGRAYCLLGKPENAVQSYSEYIRLKPGNPLGYAELGMAYEEQCSTELALTPGSGNYIFCSDKKYQAKINDSWQAAKITYADFINAGEGLHKRGKLQSASDAYKRAYFIKDFPEGEFPPILTDNNVLIVEDFYSTSTWGLPCRLCVNAKGRFSSSDGIMEMSYTNNLQERDKFAYIFSKKVPILGAHELVLKVRGEIGTQLLLELVIDGIRSRPLNYIEVPNEWQMVPVAISGDTITEILLGISEKSADSNIKQYQLFMDWIILR